MHCEGYCSNSNLHSAHSLHPSSTQPQPSLPVQNTICSSAHYCSPDDGHNDARCPKHVSLIINIRLVASCWFLSLHPKIIPVKAIPLQAWTDPEGSRSLRLPDFKTVGT